MMGLPMSQPPSTRFASTPPSGVSGLRPVERLAAFNIVLLNDEQHSYNYVTRLLCEVFHMKAAQAGAVAVAVDRDGRAVVWSGHKEYAEFMRERVLAFGRDALVERCTGPMCALIEPALGA